MPRSAEFLGQTGRVAVDHVDARVAGELPFEVTRESGIQFEKKQLRVATHPGCQFARVNAFARTKLGDRPRPG